MNHLRVDRVSTIKISIKDKKSPYGQNSKPQSKFNKMLNDEIRKLKDEQVNIKR